MGILRLPIRQTKMGAHTWNVVFIKTPEGWRRIKPVITELSKSGNHGTEHYIVGDHYITISFDITNSGKRSITVKAAGEGLAKAEEIMKLIKPWEDGVEIKIKELETVLNS